MTDPVDLDRLDALHAAATPARWSVKHNAKHEESRVYAGTNQRAVFDGRPLLGQHEDAELAVALHNAWPAISAELRRLRDRLGAKSVASNWSQEPGHRFVRMDDVDAEIDRLLAEPETPEPVPEPFVEAFVALKRERDKARAETQQELADLHAELDTVRDERNEARAEASASQPAAVPSEDEIKAFIARVNNAINQMCDPLSPNFARNMVEVRAGMDVIRDRSVEFVRRAAAVHAVPYSCPACGAEMDSSRCWCCGWSNK